MHHNKQNIPHQNLFHNPLLCNAIKVSQKLCQNHGNKLGNYFCVDCLSYALCSKCGYENHKNHEIMKFNDEDQLKSETKQILLQTLEETLKALKSKQNEMKNKASELKLIKNSIQTIQKEIMTSLSTMFKEIEEQLTNFIKIEEQKYEKEIDQFYEEYNLINDKLRENLMVIIDGQVKIENFSKQMIVIPSPHFPNFPKYKNNYEKVKKSYKQLKKIVEQIDQKVKSLDQKGNGKLIKYIDTKYSGAYDKVNQPFMGMLKLMDNKENVPILNINKIINKL